MKLIDRILKPEIGYTHCDIPCGIYDPHLAQVAAHTVIRMVNLINEVKDVDRHKFSRCIAIKEEHAELVKHEIRIIWGDFIKPEHIQKFPEIPDLVKNIMTLGSKTKQTVDLDAAKELLAAVQKFSEIFWKIKGLEPIKVNAPYAGAGSQIVLHK